MTMDTVKIAAHVVKYVVLPPLVPFLIPIVLSALAWFVNQLQSRSECEGTVKKQNEPSIVRSDWSQSQPSSDKSPKKKKSDQKWSNSSKPQNTYSTEEVCSLVQQNNYSSDWVITEKHHPMVVMKYTPQDKFVAACPEDDAGGISGSSSSSEANKENSSPGRLSRRQRKNRVRKEDTSPMKKKSRKKGWSDQSGLKECNKLTMNEAELFHCLKRYMLSPNEMMNLGYPVESKFHPGRAMIYKPSSRDLDANAKEFVPRKERPQTERHSKDGSARTSFLDQTFEPINKKQENCRDKKSVHSDKNISYEYEKKCVRCQKIFFISHDGEYLTQEQCIYHWGKLRNPPSGVHESHYSCCKGKADSKGCSTGKVHVWSGLEPGSNGPLDGYMKTKPRKIPPLDGNYGVYSLDCEMCFTNSGLELTKVSVVGLDGRSVYETFVRPENCIVDYNTRFSGITAKDMSRGNKVKTLKDVHNDLNGFISADTILIGHGLENDLRALRLVHGSVVDTAVMFPHVLGLPFKRSLKSLVNTYLQKDIQSGPHDSYEDASSCLQLVLWKLRKDLALQR